MPLADRRYVRFPLCHPTSSKHDVITDVTFLEVAASDVLPFLYVDLCRYEYSETIVGALHLVFSSSC
jgi:hypothetical protein